MSPTPAHGPPFGGKDMCLHAQVYWLGPIPGAMLGALIYCIFFDFGRPVKSPTAAFNDDDLTETPV